MTKWSWLISTCFISFVIVSTGLVIWGILKQNIIANIIPVAIFGAIALVLAFFQVVRLPPVTPKQRYISFSIIGIAILLGAVIVGLGLLPQAKAEDDSGSSPTTRAAPSVIPQPEVTLSVIPSASVTPTVITTATGTPTAAATSTPTINQLCAYLKQGDLTSAYNKLFGDYFHRAVTSQDFVNGFRDYTECTQVKQVSATEYDITFSVLESLPKTKRFIMQRDGLIYTYEDR